MQTQLPTPDLCDAHPDARVCALPWRSYGGRRQFHGPIRTVKVFEDNVLVRSALETPGRGAVLVVDGGASLRCALVGGLLGELAQSNGWSGIVVNGCVRDSEELRGFSIGVLALATHPRKSLRGLHGGAVDCALEFGGITLRPGEWLYADADGVVVLPVRHG
jgi:regulator of ribonuclease activity A